MLLGLAAHVASRIRLVDYTLLTRTHLLLNDVASARTTLAEAERALAREPRAPRLAEQVAALRQQVSTSPIAGADAGPASLSAAELRVLEYLPTHLTLQEIAERLFVSRNTVKSQAISSYRKLGVSSRNAAVERSRELGLIER